MGMPKEKPRSIVSARKDYCRQILSMNEESITPEDAGLWVHEKMQDEWGDAYPAELAVADCVKDVLKEQSKTWRSVRQSDDLFGDNYLDANVKDADGKLIKVKYTTSDFHDGERENQIVNLRRINVSFERDEQRRDLLKEAGLWDIDGMTTEQAVWKSQK